SALRGYAAERRLDRAANPAEVCIGSRWRAARETYVDLRPSRRKGARAHAYELRQADREAEDEIQIGKVLSGDEESGHREAEDGASQHLRQRHLATCDPGSPPAARRDPCETVCGDDEHRNEHESAGNPELRACLEKRVVR